MNPIAQEYKETTEKIQQLKIHLQYLEKELQKNGWCRLIGTSKSMTYVNMCEGNPIAMIVVDDIMMGIKTIEGRKMLLPLMSGCRKTDNGYEPIIGYELLEMAAIAKENAFGRITTNGRNDINNMNIFCQNHLID